MSDFKNDIECYTDNVYLDHAIMLIPRLMVYLLMLILYTSDPPQTLRIKDMHLNRVMCCAPNVVL